MKTRRITAVLLIACLLIAAAMPVQAEQGKQALPLSAGIDALRGQFESGCGPEADGYAIDYAYYSPAGQGETEKYPLVIWLHGMMQGGEPGQQVAYNEFAYWSSAEFQARFTGAGGAYLFVPRSHEEQYLYWNDSMLVPLKAAIDDFIAQHRDTVDTTRIYIGGFSMGGKMTLKMAVAYPDFFAAAFPVCPALFRPSQEQMDALRELPVWFVASKYDVLAGYYSLVDYEWEYLTSITSRPADLRLSVLGEVRNPDGSKAGSNHEAWVAVNYDLFTVENGDYYAMETVDGSGRPVTLTYPEGMIAWLSQFSSDSDGAPSSGSGQYRVRSLCEELVALVALLPNFIRTLWKIALDYVGLVSCESCF